MVCSVRLPGPRCRSALLTPVGDVLIAACETAITTWSVPTGQRLAEHRVKKGGNFALVIRDGHSVITGSNATLEIRELPSLKLEHVLEQQHDMNGSGLVDLVGDVALDPAGRTLVSGSWNGTLTIWDLATRQAMVTMQAHDTGVHRVAFSTDGQTLFSAGHDGKVRVWSAIALAGVLRRLSSRRRLVQRLRFFGFFARFVACWCRRGNSDSVCCCCTASATQSIAPGVA